MGVHECSLHTRRSVPPTLWVLWTAPESQPDMPGMGHS